MVTVIEVGIIVAKILAQNTVFISTVVAIEVVDVDVPSGPIGLTWADTDAIELANIVIVLLLALDLIDVSFDVVVSKWIEVLVGAIMARFMIGFAIEVLVDVSLNNCTAANTACKFSVPTLS